MLTFVVLIGLIAVFGAVSHGAYNKSWDRYDIVSTLTAAFCALSIILLIMSAGYAVINTAAVSKSDTARRIMEYHDLQEQVNSVKRNETSIDVSELSEAVKRWNSDLANYSAYKNNIWTNVFFPVDISKIDYIDIRLLSRGG